MNIALPALVIVLGLLPGIVFFHAYFSGRFPKRVADVSPVSELALYILFALPLDALALGALRWLGLQLDYALVARLLVGDAGEEATSSLAAAIGPGLGVGARTYVTVLIACFLAGHVLRKIVWTLRLDTRAPLLRMKHEWYYLLQGRLPGLPRTIAPYADVLIEHPDGTQLYQGVVSGFEVTSDGQIRQLILRNAYRGKDRGEQFKWKPIPGDRFIVMGAAIRSINLRYIVIHAPDVGSKWDRLKRSLRRTARTFFFEEP